MWEGGKFLRKLPRHILSLTGTFQSYSTRKSPLVNFDDIFYEVPDYLLGKQLPLLRKYYLSSQAHLCQKKLPRHIKLLQSPELGRWSQCVILKYGLCAFIMVPLLKLCNFDSDLYFDLLDLSTNVKPEVKFNIL